MSKLIENLQNLGSVRLTVLAAVGTTIIAAIALMIGLMARSETALLYAGLDRAAFEGVVSELRRLNVPFDASAEEGAVRVDSRDVASLRMSLAAQGLPAPSTTGYELFEQQGTFGLTSFMQRINWTRALEGELARTVQSLDGIRSARVHLVLPDREDFSRESQRASASVVIDPVNATSLNGAQATAIRHLIATAVPALATDAVTVMDTSGNVIAAEGSGLNQIAQRANDLTAAYEQRVKERIENLLIPRVGLGNVRVSVAAELDFAREAVREQTFDPRSRVLRSVQTIEENERSSEESGEEPVTVGQNLPLEPNFAGDEAGLVLHEASREEETNNFEINSVTRERVRENGVLERLSVAVMINGVPVENADGTITVAPRDPAELERIETLVKSAIGFSDARGDQVTVDSLEFIDGIALFAPDTGGGVMPVLARQVSAIVQWVVLLIALVFLVQVVLRPLLSRLLEDNETAGGKSALDALADGTEDAPQALAYADGTPMEAPALPRGDSADEDGEFPALTAGEHLSEEGRALAASLAEDESEVAALVGAVSASSVRRLRATVERYPEAATAILRSVMYEEAG